MTWALFPRAERETKLRTVKEYIQGYIAKNTARLRFEPRSPDCKIPSLNHHAMWSLNSILLMRTLQ